MSYKPYPTRDAKKNYFLLPNEIFDFGLSSTAIALYAYLMKLENRKTHDCFPAYKTIAKSISVKSKVTVAKYVNELEEKQLIETEQRTVPVDIGIVRKSTLRYNIRPIQEAIDWKNERQMAKLEHGVAVEKAKKNAARKGGNEGCEARNDASGIKHRHLNRRRCNHICRSAGRFEGFTRGSKQVSC